MYIIAKVHSLLGGVIMTVNENKAKYDMQYAKNNLKRIPLDVRKEKYEQIRAAAEAAGESVNLYIKTAIDQRMERDEQK
jgi:predicted HicB family RNase H-like nuclease